MCYRKWIKYEKRYRNVSSVMLIFIQSLHRTKNITITVYMYYNIYLYIIIYIHTYICVNLATHKKNWIIPALYPLPLLLVTVSCFVLLKKNLCFYVIIEAISQHPLLFCHKNGQITKYVLSDYCIFLGYVDSIKVKYFTQIVLNIIFSHI